MDTTHQETIRAYLDEVREREKGATEGPWQHTYKDCAYFMNSEFIDRKGDPNGVALVTSDINQSNATLYATDEDMDFIAAARTDIPRLLDMLAIALVALDEIEGEAVYPPWDVASEALEAIAAIARGEEGQEA